MSRLLKITVSSCATLLCMSMGIVAILWFGVANIDHFRPSVESFLAKTIDRKMTIEAIAITWKEFSPTLVLQKTRIFDTKAETVIASLPRVEIDIDLLESWRTKNLATHKIHLHRAVFELERTGDEQPIFGNTAFSVQDAALRENSALAGFFSSPQKFELRAVQFKWSGANGRNTAALLTDIDIDLMPKKDGYRLNAHVSFNLTTAEPNLQATLAQGEGVTERQEGLRAKEQTHALPVYPSHSRLPTETTSTTHELPSQGTAEIVFNAQIEKGRLVGGHAQFEIETLPPHTLHAHTRITFIRTLEGWEIKFIDPSLARNKQTVRLPDLGLEIAFDTENTYHYRLLNTALPVQELASFLSSMTDSPYVQWLTSVNSDAVITELEFTNNTAQQWQLKGSFTSFGMALNSIPSLKLTDSTNISIAGINGQFSLQPNSTHLILRGSSASELLLGSEQRLALPKIHAVVEHQRESDGWGMRIAAAPLQIESVSLNLDANLRASSPQPLHLILSARSSYIPLTWLTSHLTQQWPNNQFVHWLTRALDGAALTDVRVDYAGPADGLLRLDPALNATGNINSPAFGFASPEGWPSVTDAKGTLTLKGRHFEGKLEDGESLGATVGHVLVTVSDILSETIDLRINGMVATTSEIAMNYVTHSPLNDKFGTQIKAVSLNGSSIVNFKVTLPFTKDAAKVEGKIELIDNRVRSNDIAIELEDLSGTIHFNNQGISAEHLQALYLGAPMNITLVPVHDKIEVLITGEADFAFLHRLMRTLNLPQKYRGIFTQEYISGHTPWRAKTVIGETNNARRLIISSKLKGLGIHLPAPLHKTKKTVQPTTIEVVFDPEERLISVHSGSNLSGQLLLYASQADWLLDAGAINLGPTLPDIPPPDEFRVRGETDRISTDAWLRFLNQTGPIMESAGEFFSLDIDIALEKLEVMGSEVSVDYLRLKTYPQGKVIVGFQGEELAGVLQKAVIADKSHFNVHLERLFLDQGSHELTELIDPRVLPRINATIEDFHYGDLSLGRLEMTAIPFEEGVRFHDTTLSSPGFNLKGEGEWVYINPQQQRSSVNIELRAEELSNLFEHFALEDNMLKGGRSEIDLQAKWAGPPTEFSLSQMTGHLSISATDGLLPNIKRGVTERAFGLLSLQSLPQLLTLDFSKVFRQGFFYDELKGSFSIDQGSAQIDDLFMKGTNALITIEGDTDLIDKRYQQQVTVIPKLTNFLPFAPLWFAELLLRYEFINRAFATRYVLTGPWDKPQLIKQN